MIKKPRILFVLTDWVNKNVDLPPEDRYGGVSYYRCIKPMEELQKLGYECDKVGADFRSKLDEKNLKESYYNFIKPYDLVVCKQTDNVVAYRWLRMTTQDLGIPLVIDIDDDYFNIDEYHIAWDKGYHIGGEKRIIQAVHLSLADEVWVSTEPLRESINKVMKAMDVEQSIKVLNNYVCLDDFKKQKASDEEVIGWQGSITHDKDLLLVAPVLEKLSKTRGTTIEFFGGITPHFEKKIRKDYPDMKLRVVNGVSGWVGFPDVLSGLSWTVSICPLESTMFTKSKSHIKWMESTAVGVPVVASNVTPYKDFIVEGTGILTDNWYKDLTRLLKNKELQAKLKENAYSYIKDNLTYEGNIDKWVEAIDSIV